MVWQLPMSSGGPGRPAGFRDVAREMAGQE